MTFIRTNKSGFILLQSRWRHKLERWGIINYGWMALLLPSFMLVFDDGHRYVESFMVAIQPISDHQNEFLRCVERGADDHNFNIESGILML